MRSAQPLRSPPLLALPLSAHTSAPPPTGEGGAATTNTTTPNASRDRPMPFEKKAAKPTIQEDPTSVTNSPLHAGCAANPHGYAEGLQRLFATYHPDPHG